VGRSAAFAAVGMGEEEPLNISSSLLPHNLRNTELGVLQRSKHRATAVSTSSKVAKNRLCVARRRASFQTRSTGASCGLSGGRNSRVSTARYFRSHGLRRIAWWSRALSSTSTMRVSRERCCNGVFRKVSNVAALNVAHRERMTVPVRKRTAPKQATDWRVGAWRRTGSLIADGTHMRHWVPCCWKWHSSTLQSSTPPRRARRCSFFKRRDLVRVGLGNLRLGLAQPESHGAEEAVALAPPVAQAQMRREQLAVPQMTSMTEFLRLVSQVTPQRRPLRGVQGGWTTHHNTTRRDGKPPRTGPLVLQASKCGLYCCLLSI